MIGFYNNEGTSQFLEDRDAKKLRKKLNESNGKFVDIGEMRKTPGWGGLNNISSQKRVEFHFAYCMLKDIVSWQVTWKHKQWSAQYSVSIIALFYDERI